MGDSLIDRKYVDPEREVGRVVNQQHFQELAQLLAPCVAHEENRRMGDVFVGRHLPRRAAVLESAWAHKAFNTFMERPRPVQQACLDEAENVIQGHASSLHGHELAGLQSRKKIFYVG